MTRCPNEIGTDPILEDTRRRLGNRPAAPFTALRRARELSFELFPAQSEAQHQAFQTCVDALAPLTPSFFSVTYGAGGTTQARTLDAVGHIRQTTAVPVAGHLTCVSAPRRDVDAVIERYLELGVRHVVALRGDSPPAASDGGLHPEGYRDAAELTRALMRRGDFEVSVAAYPEVHPRAASSQADLDNLKRKVDEGASRAITQFFFEPEIFLRFLDRARAAGITVPIVPGILPVHRFAQVQRFAGRCGAQVPAWMADLFEPLEESPEVRPLVAATVAAELCMRLVDRGIDRFHFYTLNRAPLTQAVCHLLGHGASLADAGNPSGTPSVMAS